MKKISFFLLYVLLSFLTTSIAFALEIDEKLTLRVIKLSDTKKTMLINRGIEDGLAEGDHAKFFITTGVVARGVVSKVSPTRSVWSLYRLVNPELINQDTVMNLKISSPVKVSEDETRMIVKDPEVVAVATGDPNRPDIPLADGADDLEKGMDSSMNKSERDEMASVMTTSEESKRSILHRNMEIYGFLNLQLLSGSTKRSSDATSADAEFKQMHILAAGEYYFSHEDRWYSRFSFSPYIGYNTDSATGGDGTHTVLTIFEYGLGVSYHPFAKPSESMTPIPFVTMGLGGGAFNSKTENTFPAVTSNTVDQAGSLATFFIGGGLKYYWSNGFGLRGSIDYYRRSTDLAGVPATNDNSFEIIQSGFRTFVGAGYRF